MNTENLDGRRETEALRAPLRCDKQLPRPIGRADRRSCARFRGAR
jgi:hypothetical protein